MSVHVLNEELFNEGNRLLRMITRAYYSPPTAIVVNAFIHLSKPGEKLEEADIANHLKLSGKRVHEHLRQLENDRLLVSEVYEEKQEKVKNDAGESVLQTVTVKVTSNTAGVYKRGRVFRTYWLTNFEQMINIIRYKHLHMLLKIDGLTSESKYACMNLSCLEYKKELTEAEALNQNILVFSNPVLRSGTVVKQEDPYSTRIADYNRRSANPSLQYQSRNRFQRSGRSAYSKIKQEPTDQAVPPAGGATATVTKPDPSATTTENIATNLPVNPTSSSDPSQVVRLGSITDAFVCTCLTPLSLCNEGTTPQEKNIKQLFNDHTYHITNQTTKVFELLKQVRELIAKDPSTAATLNGNGSAGATTDSTAKNVGVGAKVGFSTANDLANRVEQSKELLPWDEMSATDQRARLEEEERARKNQEELYRLEQERLRRQEQERQVELRNEELAREQRQRELVSQTFASTGITIPSTSVQQQSAANLAPTSSLPYPSGGDLAAVTYNDSHSGTTMADGGSYNDSNHQPQEDQQSEVYVTVQGVSKPLAQITEADLDLMDEDEFNHYSSLV